MATDTVIKEVVPYTQNEIETEVKSILFQKGFTDILYPGSNISQISDVMTYLVHVLNTNTAANLQEVILPLATKRLNVLYGARQLGYEATQKISYQYELEIAIRENPDTLPEETFIVTIPKYAKFTSGDKSYYYFGEEIRIETTNLTRFDHNIKLVVKEGNLIQSHENSLLAFRAKQDTTDSGEILTKQNYIVPFKNVEDDGLEVFLTYIEDNGVNIVREEWSKSDQFLVDSSFSYYKNRFIRLQNLFLQMPTLFFQIGGYGSPVRLNTLIECNVLISSGADGAAKSTFSVDNGELANLISVNTGTVVKYGANEESIESIKENAPIFHNSANRAVTALDYIAVSQRHAAVSKAQVFGIEEEYEPSGFPSYATVFFSFTPERTDRTFKSVSPLTNYTTNDERPYTTNEKFQLMHLPDYPRIEYVENPDDGVVPPVPSLPAWMPRPYNYLEVPVGWDPANPVSEPVSNVINPGQNPGTPDVADASRPTLPSDWVENPYIDGWDGNLSNINPALTVIQTALQKEAYEYYKTKAGTTWTQGLEDADVLWYSTNSTLYHNWLALSNVQSYVQWRRDNEIYQHYLEQVALWEQLKIDYAAYTTYLESREGASYTAYWNSFGEYTDPKYDAAQVLAREQADILYSDYIDAKKIYEEYTTEIDLYVDNWYLDDENDVYRMSNPPKLPERDTNVFTVLDAYKILTMRHEHRKPAYVNFDYDISVVRYDLSVPKSETNKKIFDIIDNYFTSYMENYGVEYFASTLQRKVDEVLGDTSGVEIDLNTYVSLHESMIDPYYKLRGDDQIRFRLALPYENLYPDGVNLTENRFLPSIDTTGFTLHNADYVISELIVDNNISVNVRIDDYVLLDDNTNGAVGTIGYYYKSLSNRDSIDLTSEDFTNVTNWEVRGLPKDLYVAKDIDNYYAVPGGSTIQQENIVLPIYFGSIADNGATDPIVGNYIIRNSSFQFIDVILFFNTVQLQTQTNFGVNEGVDQNDVFMHSGYGYIDLTYPSNINSLSDNIPFTGYTIPRLRTVRFN